MALIFVEGFDTQDMNLKWNGATPTGYGGGRLGTGSTAFFNGLMQTKLLFTQLSQMFIGWAETSSLSSGFGHGMVIRGDSGATAHLSIIYGVSGVTLTAGFFGAVLASAQLSMLPNTWYYFEAWVVLATSGGRCQVRVNGTQVIDFTGNTMNGGTNTTVDSFQIGTTNSSITDVYDDIYVCDATGTTNNTFLGDVRIQTLRPTANGTSTQLTPTGSVNNWQNTSDAPDVPTTYNSSSVSGNRDTYTMADLVASTGTVFGTQDNIHAYKTDAGAISIKPALLSGASLTYGSNALLSTASAQWYSKVHDTDPNTGLAWTPAGLNAAELGAEVV